MHAETISGSSSDSRNLGADHPARRDNAGEQLLTV